MNSASHPITADASDQLVLPQPTGILQPSVPSAGAQMPRFTANPCNVDVLTRQLHRIGHDEPLRQRPRAAGAGPRPTV